MQAQAAQVTALQAAQQAAQDASAAKCGCATAAMHYDNAVAFHHRLTSVPAAVPVTSDLALSCTPQIRNHPA
jgi:hypothetical protein